MKDNILFERTFVIFLDRETLDTEQQKYNNLTFEINISFCHLGFGGQSTFCQLVFGGQLAIRLYLYHRYIGAIC